MACHTNVLLIDDEASIFEAGKATVFEVFEFSVVLVVLATHLMCTFLMNLQPYKFEFSKKYVQNLLKSKLMNFMVMLILK